jgi:hypothetical protein
MSKRISTLVQAINIAKEACWELSAKLDEARSATWQHVSQFNELSAEVDPLRHELAMPKTNEELNTF